MFYVYLTNFGLYKDSTSTLDDAIALGKGTGFEFSVFTQSEGKLVTVGFYSPLRGWSGTGE